jgi:hypothetical protein
MMQSMPYAGRTELVSPQKHHILAQDTPPATPDGLKPYRSSGRAALGVPTPHYHTFGTFDVPQDRRYGAVYKRDDSTAERFAAMKVQEFAQHTRPYASDLREPLGKSGQSVTVLPEFVNNKDFRYGTKTVHNEGAAQAMYPGVAPVTSPAKEPMAQQQRNYTWSAGNVDLATHRFGKIVPRDPVGGDKPTSIIAMQSAVHLDGTNVPVGSPRGGRAPPQLSPTRLVTKDNGGSVKALLVSPSRDRSDDRIGKPECFSQQLRKLREADVPKNADTHTFGLASVRTDRVAPKYEHVANTINYGNEPSAGQLLYPSPSKSAGGAFLANVEEAEALARRCDLGLSPVQVERAFAAASRKENFVSAAAFHRALCDMGL